MTAAPVRIEADGPLLTITLDAPERRNALTPEMLCRLADAFVALRDDAALRVAIVTGSGERALGVSASSDWRDRDAAPYQRLIAP